MQKKIQKEVLTREEKRQIRLKKIEGSLKMEAIQYDKRRNKSLSKMERDLAKKNKVENLGKDKELEALKVIEREGVTAARKILPLTDIDNALKLRKDIKENSIKMKKEPKSKEEALLRSNKENIALSKPKTCGYNIGKSINQISQELQEKEDKELASGMQMFSDVAVAGAMEKAKRELARRKFRHYVEYMKPDFIFSAFNLELIQAYQDLYDLKFNRLMICMPPRHGKTMITNLYASWTLGKDSTEDVMTCAYGITLSAKSSRDILGRCKNPKFKIIFPNFMLNVAKQGAIEWETYNPLGNGGVLAAGTGSGITGRGFTLGIIDDAIKNFEVSKNNELLEKINDWYTSTFYTRMQTAKRDFDAIKIVVIMTRRNINDLAGWLLKEEEKGGEKWKLIKFQAISDETGDALFPERIPLDKYLIQKRALGPQKWFALYQQNPLLAMGNKFKQERYKYFYRSDFNNDLGGLLKKDDCTWGIHIDPAFSTRKGSDDTVIALVGKHKITKDLYIWDLRGGTISPVAAFNEIFNMITRAKIEKINIGYVSIEQVNLNTKQTKFKTDFMEEMKERDEYYTLLDFRPVEKKLPRIESRLAPLYERGKIFHLNPKDFNYDENQTLHKKLEEQLQIYPYMDHDDVPDCIAQAAYMLRAHLGARTKEEKNALKNEKVQKRFTINPMTKKPMYLK